MAKVNFNNLDDDALNGGSTNTAGNDVGFFTLKNDNDEAVVRFMCDSTDDFEILTVHDIQLGQRFRKVNCIRDPREPLDNCPLCKNGAKISNRFFIKLIQYDKVTDPNTGVQSIVPKAMVWERSTAYAKTLKSYLDNYGPLSDIICKIIRHGKAGDMQTTYEIVPNLSKAVFRDDVYVKDTSLFGTFEAFGTIVMDRTFDEMNHFVATGEFPARQTQSPQNSTPEITPRTYDAPPATMQPAMQSQPMQNTYQPSVTPTYQPQPSVAPVTTPELQVQPQTPPTAPAQTMSWQAPNASGGFDRPRRY